MGTVAKRRVPVRGQTSSTDSSSGWRAAARRRHQRSPTIKPASRTTPATTMTQTHCAEDIGDAGIPLRRLAQPQFLPRDDHALDFAGAFVDFSDLGVAEVALDGQ